MAASTLYTTGMEHSPVGRHRVGAHAVAGSPGCRVGKR